MKKFCEKAIVYIKESISSDVPAPVVVNIDPNAPVLRELACGLCVAYVVDQNNHLIYVQNHHLKESGVTADELHEIGIANLARLTDEKLRVQQLGSIFGVFLDGNFESSLILYDHLWDVGVAGAVKNGIVIAIPTRDVLAFCDSRSDQGIATLRKMIARTSGGDHPISTSLFERINGNWFRRN
jgi:uncharacterized protein YtpQ (UPF0354 family)